MSVQKKNAKKELFMRRKKRISHATQKENAEK